jgi:tetratricopeptide (TPR) repeat protein
VLLADGPRDLPERHRGLHATVDSSYRLLTPSEQLVFERVSIFAGRFSVDAAQAVAAFGSVGANEVVACVASLVSKSLIVREGDAYRLLEPIRQFGAEHLAARGDHDAAADHHLEHFVTLGERLGIGLTTSGSPDDLDTLRQSEPNLRIALSWAFADSRLEVRALGVRLVGATLWRWFVDGPPDEGRAWADRAVQASASMSVDLRLLALYSLSLLTLGQDLATAMDAAIEMQRLAPSSDHEAFAAFASDIRGNAHWGQGELAAAEEQLAESVAIAARIGLRWHEAFARAELARVVFDRGDRTRAAELAADALAFATALGEPMQIAFALDVTASQALARGAIAEAATFAADGLAHYRLVRYREGIASACQLLARTALVRGDHAMARRMLDEVARIHRQLSHRSGLAAAFETYASLYAVLGHDEDAAALLGMGDALRRSAGIPLTASEHPTVDALRRELADRLGSQFDKSRRRGELLDIDAAISNLQTQNAPDALPRIAN